jgi:hypothetical protein
LFPCICHFSWILYISSQQLAVWTLARNLLHAPNVRCTNGHENNTPEIFRGDIDPASRVPCQDIDAGLQSYRINLIILSWNAPKISHSARNWTVISMIILRR